MEKIPAYEIEQQAPTIVRESDPLYQRSLRINAKRTCSCKENHLNCLTPKEWIKSQLGVGNKAFEKAVTKEWGEMVNEGLKPGTAQFQRELGTRAGERAQLLIQRWARRQSGSFAAENWGYGDINPQLRLPVPLIWSLIRKPQGDMLFRIFTIDHFVLV